MNVQAVGPAEVSTLYNDEPTLEDLLGRAELASKIGETIAKCAPPQVFGIHGEWGSGKTSLLHQVQLFLSGECPAQTKQGDECIEIARRLWTEEWKRRQGITVVWFEAWRYQYEQAPVVALLQEIRAQLSWQLKLGRALSKTTQVAIESALLSLDSLTKMVGIQGGSALAATVQKTGEKWEQSDLSYGLPSYMIRQHLERAIEQVLGKGKRTGARLVVLVDDLDRCNGEAAYKLLEGIKIYLNLPSCVFVLGMNRHVVEDAVGNHINSLDKSRQSLAKAYLEKLCQNIYYLPVLQNPALYLSTLLLNANMPDVAVAEIQQIVTDSECLPYNPRKVKGFANVLIRFLDRLGGRLGDGPVRQRNLQLVVLMANLYLYHDELYRMILAKPSFYNLVRQWANCEDVGHPLLTQLDRPLSKVKEDDRAPVPEDRLEDAFIDPVQEDVFRVQVLVRQLGDVTIDEILGSII